MRGDGGGVTVETAIAVCALLFLLVVCLAALAAVTGSVRCTDAAREAARLVARGDPARAEQAVRAIGPSGARLSVRVDGDEISVEVTASPVGGLLPGWRLRGQAHAVLEPGVAAR
ncbi:TadE family type IV pilus minor pilin [Kutzneria viridogrisea]|uniref:Flp pilus assembly protein TadG n=1 Tax=Kutzneria viridogrisea TaxID=47990 RepID=A0ABR6BX42_9PSEU|nr:Flp pilus assembly protein TadG [Kutzneria viridogrisea]